MESINLQVDLWLLQWLVKSIGGLLIFAVASDVSGAYPGGNWGGGGSRCWPAVRTDLMRRNGDTHIWLEQLLKRP